MPLPNKIKLDYNFMPDLDFCRKISTQQDIYLYSIFSNSRACTLVIILTTKICFCSHSNKKQSKSYCSGLFLQCLDSETSKTLLRVINNETFLTAIYFVALIKDGCSTNVGCKLKAFEPKLVNPVLKSIWVNSLRLRDQLYYFHF